MTESSSSYPIGKFERIANPQQDQIDQWIQEIEELPAQLQEVVAELTDEQLDTPYRDGGWTVRQVVHHLVDSHVNSYVRFRWALTEDSPTIKAYDQDGWASLPDAQGPLDLSMPFLAALHKRWVALLRSMTPDQFQRTFLHPETGAAVDLATNTGIYAWHGRHYLAHITGLIERSGW